MKKMIRLLAAAMAFTAPAGELSFTFDFRESNLMFGKVVGYDVVKLREGLLSGKL